MWGIDTSVLFTVGGGQGLLACMLERKRAVGIVEHPRHRAFVNNNLKQAVKTLRLAPGRRPDKPAELVAWEHSRTVGDKIPAFWAASSSASSKAAPSEPVGLFATSGAPSAPPASLVAGTMGAPPAPAQAAPASAAAAPTLAAFGQSALR